MPASGRWMGEGGGVGHGQDRQTEEGARRAHPLASENWAGPTGGTVIAAESCTSRVRDGNTPLDGAEARNGVRLKRGQTGAHRWSRHAVTLEAAPKEGHKFVRRARMSTE